MADHGARDHATWSASATERNWQCPGALALTDGLPEQTSQASDWGTCAHQIAEHCLFDLNKDADSFIGTTVKGKVHSFEVDEEMAETAQAYVDYCRARVARYKAETGQNALVFVEERLTLDALDPPFDAGGIADYVMIFPLWKLIEVVDLKGGRGVVVEVVGNPQERTYALGTLLKHRGHDIERVMSTIVQPRAFHKSGRIRSETYHIADLAEWTADLMAAMRRSAQASADYEKIGKGQVNMAGWVEAHLNPGDHCDNTFCKARATCPALERRALDAAGVWFDDLSQPRLANDPDADDPAKLARDLDMLDLIEGWIKARRERAHHLAESGVEITDPVSGSTYILVDKEGREKWIDGVEDKVLAAAKEAGLAPAKYLNPGKLRTPKQVRKDLGSKAGLVAGLSDTPRTGHNLVRADKTSREAATPTVTQFFEAPTN